MDEGRGSPWRTIREIRALLEVLGSEVTAQRRGLPNAAKVSDMRKCLRFKFMAWNTKGHHKKAA
jgi:hypothetical protein